jgi:hypothetical protein
MARHVTLCNKVAYLPVYFALSFKKAASLLFSVFEAKSTKKRAKRLILIDNK